jgi:predicted phage replisome organizer
VAKKFYWLKLKDDFFRNKKIKKMRKSENGDLYTIIYLKLQLLSLKQDGSLVFEHIEETFCEELALEIDENEDDIEATILFLEKNKLIEKVEDNKYLMLETIQNIGSEGSSAERVRKHREKKKALQCNTSNENSNIEIEKEKEIEKENIKEVISFQDRKQELQEKLKLKYGKA